MDISNKLQAMQTSEINWTISCFYDSGFEWWLGDDFNTFTANGEERTFEAAARALIDAALKQYPESDFAKAHAAVGA